MPPTIAPYLLYEDVEAALDFLSRAFGFEETLRYTGPEGYVNHAEMRIGDGVIYMGDPGEDYRNPAHVGARTQMVCVTVDDVDATFERARAAGAEISEEPTDQDYGERRFMARDPEGHAWSIAQPIGDPAPEDWGATPAQQT
jgi:PhnB protein